MWDSCRWFGEQITTASSDSKRSRSSMSSNASFTANRSASARAFGRSVSQIACTSMVLSFLSTGRWATWVIAPPPMIPTLSRSLPDRLAVMRPSSVDALERGAGVVRREDALEVVSGAGAPDGAPLAKADAVPGPAALRHQPRDPAARARRGERERGAPEQIAGRGTENPPDGGAVNQHLVRPERDREAADAAGTGPLRHPHVPDLTHLVARDPGGRGKGASDRRPERVARPLFPPPIAGRDAAVVGAVLVHVGERPQVWPRGR